MTMRRCSDTNFRSHKASSVIK